MPATLYAVYVTGVAGSNIVLLYVGDTVVGGVDAGLGKYRGAAERLPNGGLRGMVKLTVPPGATLITGGVAPPGMQEIPIEFDLPPGFDQNPTPILLKTPIGPVNTRFEKIMDL
ncbi:MAG: hypothetical protein K9G48_08725 [Reyranella sp.]|nr:hypothetical protein [Reyranella sp.]